MFPLKNRKLIRGCEAHIKAGLGCGADYVANYVPLYAPFSGQIETYTGVQGGNWLRLIRPNGDKIEFAHLSKYLQTGGQVSEGEQIAITGNTGQITTNPHLHVQIINKLGKRLDPEQYWGKETMAQIKTQAKGASRRIVLEAATEQEWEVLCKVYGKDPKQTDENVS